MPCLSVIFDLDGTLLDTLFDLAATCNDVLRDQSFPTHPVAAYKSFVGDGLQVLMQKITPSDTDDEVMKKCCIQFKERYLRNWRRNSCPYPGINDMLSGLQKHGISLAVLSNKPHDFTKLFVDHFFPPGLFSLVYGQRDDFPKKPDPSVALDIANAFGSLPGETLFVGDSGVDIMTGKAAHMVTAGVSWGFRSVRELEENNADIIVHHPMEIERYVVSPT